MSKTFATTIAIIIIIIIVSSFMSWNKTAQVGILDDAMLYIVNAME